MNLYDKTLEIAKEKELHIHLKENETVQIIVYSLKLIS